MILLDGFSKIYAMTGWRLGFGIMPADLAVQVSKLQTIALPVQQPSRKSPASKL
jgi:aspartate/methionine/tyrosine aminotransferase